MSLRATILGASGYGGEGLIRRLARHEGIGSLSLGSRSYAGRPLADVWPHLAGRYDLWFREPDDALEGADVLFLATPHGSTAPWVRRAREAGARVVDLSADSRLDPRTYADWYGEHPHPESWEECRYGLVESHRAELAGAAVVAAPGCNATAVSLALLPLAAAGVLGEDPVCTVLAGASGAGRGLGLGLHFSELSENARPYLPAGTHRHLAEIEATLGRARDQGRELTTHAPFRPHRASFTPQLVPMARGILATCTVRPTRDLPAAELAELYRDHYAGEEVVHVQDELPQTKSVTGTDRALVSVRRDERTGMVTAFCAIDNVGKGAAGQAVQGFNVAFGYPETTALELEGRWP